MKRRGLKILFLFFIVILLPITNAITSRTKLNGSSLDSTSKILHERTIIWGSPDPPNLTAIQPNPNTNGKVILNWEHSGSISHYWVFRDTSNITTTDGLSPIAKVYHPTQIYTDTVTINGTYYYAIIANATSYAFNSSLSNVENVTVAIIDSGGKVPSFDLPFVMIGIFTIIGLILLINRTNEKYLNPT